MVRLLVAKTYPVPTEGEKTEDLDIDRWENDGGKTHDKIPDHSHN